MIKRRKFVQTSAAWALPMASLSAAHAALATQPEQAAALLHKGGCVVAFRHALAPGSFDPPQFKLGDCGTQRNLSEEGREQARRLGVWFRQQALTAAAVRSSPWCRCMETATLAFGPPVIWQALGSPHGATEGTHLQNLRALRQALQRLRAQPGRFEAWVTHMFVLSDLAQTNTMAGEGLVLQADMAGTPAVVGRLLLP